MADLSNWLGDLWSEARGGEPTEAVGAEHLYDWADDDVLETAFAKAKPSDLPDDLAGVLTDALGSAPAAMAELSAAARRPHRRATKATQPETEPAADTGSAPATAVVEPPAVPPAAPVPVPSRTNDDILPTRRPSGGRWVALRMSLRK